MLNKPIKKFLLFGLILFNPNLFCMEAGCGDQDFNDTGKLTDFYINDHQLSEQELNAINDFNGSIKNSPLFKTSNLKDSQWLEAERDALGGEEVTIETDDNCLVPCWYFNRGKDKAVLIAPGFGGGFEEMLSLVEIYSDYDVLLLDYWGHGPHDATDKSKTAWYRNPADRFFSERFRREHLDIEAALRFLDDPRTNGREEKEQGPYKEIIGAGNCYSTLVLSKVQADAEQEGKKAFDKLIFDSSWLSTYDVAKKVAHDPYLSFDQIHGGAPWILRMFMNIPYLDSALLKLGECVLGIDLHEHSIIQHISQVNCPILFIQGSADKLVTNDEFQTILSACNAPILVLKTPDKHSVIRYKSKEIYKFIVDIFIANGIDDIAFHQQDMHGVINFHLNNKPEAEQLNHLDYDAPKKKEKFFDVKTSIVSFITLAAACYVGYTLYGSPSKETIDTLATLKID